MVIWALKCHSWFVLLWSYAAPQKSKKKGTETETRWPNHPNFNKVFHYFHHPFWGTTVFGNIQMMVEAPNWKIIVKICSSSPKFRDENNKCLKFHQLRNNDFPKRNVPPPPLFDLGHLEMLQTMSSCWTVVDGLITWRGKVCWEMCCGHAEICCQHKDEKKKISWKRGCCNLKLIAKKGKIFTNQSFQPLCKIFVKIGIIFPK